MKRIIIIYILLPALISAGLAAYVMHRVDQRVIDAVVYENEELSSRLQSALDNADDARRELIETERQIDRLTKKLNAQIEYVQWIQEEYPYPMPIMHKIEVIKNCLKYGYDPHVQFKLTGFESEFDPKNQNPTSSARGYGQLIYSTAKWIYEDKLKLGDYNHDLAFDPYINIQMSTWYMDYLIDRNKGSVKRALKGYNGYELGDLYWKKVFQVSKGDK